MRNFGQVVPRGSQKKLRLIKILTRVLTAIPKNKQMKTNSQRLKIQYYKNLWCQWRFWVLRGNLVFQSFHANPHTLPKDRAMLWVYLEREVWSLALPLTGCETTWEVFSLCEFWWVHLEWSLGAQWKTWYTSPMQKMIDTDSCRILEHRFVTKSKLIVLFSWQANERQGIGTSNNDLIQKASRPRRQAKNHLTWIRIQASLILKRRGCGWLL